MASGTENDELVYAVIANIPHNYHACDLRNYFSQFIESGGFDCCHFRHRPETKKTKQNLKDHVNDNVGDAGSGNPNIATTVVPVIDDVEVAGSSHSTSSKTERDKSHRQRTTMCCIARLRKSRLSQLMKMYHKRHWLNEKGESIASLCLISALNIQSDAEEGATRYKTRKELRQAPTTGRRTDFTQKDLEGLAELHPPPLMPQGNVGTQTRYFLREIQACRLPPSVIRKLQLVFPKTRSKRLYGSVPYDYRTLPEEEEDEEEEEEGNWEEETADPLEVTSARGQQIESESEFVKAERPTQQKSEAHEDTASVGGEKPQEDSEEDADFCEDWERHEALHDDTANLERNKERLFEEKMEVTWEKGGSGLVFYTDAQFWHEKEGDFDEQTADDWDVDMSVYYEPHAGDKDSRDLIDMRREKRQRSGADGGRDAWYTAGIGQFEQYTKGIGRRVMARQGWREGQGLGSRDAGLPDALDNDGQAPFDKTGLGYRGEKLSHLTGSWQQQHPAGGAKRRRRDPDSVLISTVYDDVRETDPEEPLLRRNSPHLIKHRHPLHQGVLFTRARSPDP